MKRESIYAREDSIIHKPRPDPSPELVEAVRNLPELMREELQKVKVKNEDHPHLPSVMLVGYELIDKLSTRIDELLS